jgi:hypothetical protein
MEPEDDDNDDDDDDDVTMQFFSAIVPWPRMEPKIKGFMFKLHFRDLTAGVRATCGRITNACKQVRPRGG